MSGTSLDGIDAALLDTDGEGAIQGRDFLSESYDDEFAGRLRGILGRTEPDPETREVERELTLRHAGLVERLLAAAGVGADAVRVVGFHGHTIHHAPDTGFTWQIGDGPLLAREMGIDVVFDLRAADMEGGGEGAPLAPIFHAALAADLDPPTAVLNIGGVANLTWIGGDGELIAFDTGPGNALIDDWTRRRTGEGFDKDGALAKAGRVDRTVLAQLLMHPYFDRAPPKSLDRNEFDSAPVEGLSAKDGAATLVAFTASAIAKARDHMPTSPSRWLVSGGGRRNPAIMTALRDELAVPVAPIEDIGWNGDAVEAQAFAYFAVRRLRDLPISFPGTTGVNVPTIGGNIARTD